MRALLIAVGSRGDSEPFCALASELGNAGHKVDIFLQVDLKYLAPVHENVKVWDLSFTQMDFYKYAGSKPPSHGANHPNPKFIGVVAEIIAELVLPCEPTVSQVVVNENDNEEAPLPDIIISSSLARPLAFLLAHKYRIPIGLVHLRPLVPTRDFPHYSTKKEECIGAILSLGCGKTATSTSTAATSEVATAASIVSHGKDEFLQSYWELERYQYDFLRERLDAVYSDLGLDPQMTSFANHVKPILAGHSDQVMILNCFASELIPNASDSGPSVHSIGSLASHYVPTGWEPPDELIRFLEHDEAPICIGYGTMPLEKTKVIIDAVKKANCRAILIGACFLNMELDYCDDCDDDDDDDDVYEMTKRIHIEKSVPYPWLLPKCSMMFSHGGSGVVHSTLRAGIPAVISPFMADQYAWAHLLEEMGIGVQAGSNLSTITVDDIVDGIERARALLCQDAAKRIGQAVRRRPSGTSVLKELLEKKFAEQEII